MTGSLYVLELTGGLVKGGRAVLFPKRLKQLESDLRGHGLEIIRHREFPSTADLARNESDMLRCFRFSGWRTVVKGREIFAGGCFDRACEIAQTSAARPALPRTRDDIAALESAPTHAEPKKAGA